MEKIYIPKKAVKPRLKKKSDELLEMDIPSILGIDMVLGYLYLSHKTCYRVLI